MLHSIIRRAAVVGAVLLVFSGCNDNPVDDDHDQDHSEVIQIEFRSGSVVIYGYDASDGSVYCDETPCAISHTVGAAPLELDLVLLDEAGDEIGPQMLDEGFGVRLEVEDTGVATVADVSTETSFSARVQAVSVGETAMRVSLLHGDHADLSTPAYEDDRALVIRVTD